MRHSKTPIIRETISAEKIALAIKELTDELLKKFSFSSGNVAVVGIQTRGAVLAHRIVDTIRAVTGIDVPLGALDITLYRDDVATTGIQPVVRETHLDFDINDKQIILVDDVLFTGRTVRAALDEIMDFGRPKSISLAVLVDRGHRELPIAADFAAIEIATERDESVILHLQETDRKEDIIVCEQNR